MMLRNYAERSPESISSNVKEIAQKRLVKTIITPTIFHTTDGKILLVGDLRRRLLKLPNQRTDLHVNEKQFDITKRVKQLADFCFVNSGGVVAVDYLGILRRKVQDSVLIIPVVATLDEQSESPWLEPNSNWLKHTNRNRDHLWVADSSRRLIEGPDSDMLTVNTAGIVDYFQATKITSPV